MYILKIITIKSIKISVTTITKITDRNTGMQGVLNCQITSLRKMSKKLYKIFQDFCKMFLKQFIWTLDIDAIVNNIHTLEFLHLSI